MNTTPGSCDPATADPGPASPADPTDAAATHERLVAALARTLAAQGPIQRIQTHISSLLLGPEWAHKLKRPVRLPFLDFSDIDRRRHFLGEELRLNRRTAPGLYLEVLPVTGTLDRPRLGGDGPVLDWALRMRRFDPGASLLALARRGHLDAGHVDRLAAHLAAFHRALPPVRDLPPLDTAAWALASLDELAALPPAPGGLRAGEIAALRDTLVPRLRAARPEPAQRQAQGWVRECHGDLHLGNLVEWQGQVLAFDALEFDPVLRRTDLVADLAFPFMDLLAHGLPERAWRLVNRHVEATGDFEGLALLRDQAAYRALVRAKVAALSPAPAPEPASGPAPGEEGGGHADSDAARYARLLRGLAAAPPAPRLIVCMGLSGSGKSTLALMLAEALGAIRVRSDVERKRLFGLAATDRAPAELPLYGAEATRRTYAHLGEIAHTLLRAGLPVVVDAACLRQHEREALRGLALAHGAGFALVDCQAPAERLRARIAARQAQGDDASDATLEVLALQQRVHEPWPGHWAAWTHTVRNEGTLDALAAQARQLARRLADAA